MASPVPPAGAARRPVAPFRRQHERRPPASRCRRDANSRPRCSSAPDRRGSGRWRSRAGATDKQRQTIGGVAPPRRRRGCRAMMCVASMLSLAREERHLQAAAYVVCAYLTGMRDGEVQALRPGCLKRGLNADGKPERFSVEGIIWKDRGARGEPAEWVTIEPAAHALEVADRLSARLRAKVGDGRLWMALDDQEGFQRRRSVTGGPADQPNSGIISTDVTAPRPRRPSRGWTVRRGDSTHDSSGALSLGT